MKLLIVDDDTDVLNDITEAIEPSGYQCIKSTNPLEALAMYKKEPYDLVITDVRMPELSGIELLKKLRDYDAEARVVVMTAFGDLETAISAINNRAYAFFGKPVNFADLIKTLREVENELNQKPKIMLDYHRLKEEHEKLKEAYDGLFRLLSKYSVNEKKNSNSNKEK